MLTRGVISYAVHVLDLSAAGKHTIKQMGGVLRFHSARDVNGVIQAQAALDVRLGSARELPFPLFLGQAIYAEQNVEVTLEWVAQSGIVRAELIVSHDRSQFDLDSTPPVLQVVGTTGATINNSAVNVGVAATQLVAASANRRKLNIQNHGGDPFWIGNAAVTVATGLRLEPGESYETDISSAAWYAIATVAGVNARILEEAA